MATRKNVPASEVRAWGRENVNLVPENARAGLSETARGRIHPDLNAAFQKHNKGKRYETGVAETPTTTYKHRTTDKRGRTRWATVNLTAKDARALIGAKPQGRVSEAKVVAALEAQAGFTEKPVASTPKADSAVEKS